MQNKNIDIVATAAAFDSRRTGITRGRTHHHHFLVALFQQVIEQVPEKLQGKIFKRQGRPLEEFENPFVVRGLHQRRYSIVTEAAVGLINNRFEFCVTNCTGNKGLHHLKREFLIRKTRPARNFLGRKCWQGFGDIQATIGSQTREYHFFKTECGRLPASADVFHNNVSCYFRDSMRMRITGALIESRASIRSMAVPKRFSSTRLVSKIKGTTDSPSRASF